MATDAQQIAKSASQKALQEAMRELGKYYGLKDNSTFTQILLLGASHDGGTDATSPTTRALDEDSKKISSGLESIADAIISLRGDGKYVEELIDVFETRVTGGDPVSYTHLRAHET